MTTMEDVLFVQIDQLMERVKKLEKQVDHLCGKSAPEIRSLSWDKNDAEVKTKEPKL